MNVCASCKNKDSNERCTSKPIKGLILCGKHARVKNIRFWTEVNNVDKGVVLIQKVWRSYVIRKWLKLAGPGVLNRSVCHNDEELVTFDDKKEVHPLDYFAFEEAGKVYWFDIRSLLQNSIDKLKPVNPYTREPLSIDTRKRLRKIAILRDHRKMKNLHSENPEKTSTYMLSITWISICQIIEENGFSDTNPEYFIALNRTQLFIFINIIKQDLIAWAAGNVSPQSRRKRYIPWTRWLINEYNTGANTNMLSYVTAKYLLAMLNDYPEPYELCFIIMSALYRV